MVMMMMMMMMMMMIGDDGCSQFTVPWFECVEARTDIYIKCADCSGVMIGHAEDGQRQ